MFRGSYCLYQSLHVQSPVHTPAWGERYAELACSKSNVFILKVLFIYILSGNDEGILDTGS